jgi:hypothetical protein
MIHMSIIGGAARRSWRHSQRKTLKKKEIKKEGQRAREREYISEQKLE